MVVRGCTKLCNINRLLAERLVGEHGNGSIIYCRYEIREGS